MLKIKEEKDNLQTSTSKLSSGWPTIDPIHDKTPLKNARKARNAIKLAAMLATKAMAVLAPLAAASMTFLSVLKISTTYLRIKSTWSPKLGMHKVIHDKIVRK